MIGAQARTSGGFFFRWNWRREKRSSIIPGKGAIDSAHRASGVLPSQCFVQRGIGEALVTDRARPAVDARSADASEVAVAGSGVGATMVHRRADFDAGGEAIENEAPDLLFEHADQRREVDEILIGAVNHGGELAFEAVRKTKHVLQCRAFSDDGTRTENLTPQLLIGLQHIQCGGEDAAGSLCGLMIDPRLGFGSEINAINCLPNSGPCIVGFANATV